MADYGRRVDDVAAEVGDMTEEERALYLRHLMNMTTGNGYRHADGSLSTLFAQSVGVGDRTYMVPRVYGGAIVSPDEAVQRAREQGFDRFPSYASHQEAEARYARMHSYMDEDVRREADELAEERQRGNLSNAGLINQDQDR